MLKWKEKMFKNAAHLHVEKWIYEKKYKQMHDRFTGISGEITGISSWIYIYKLLKYSPLFFKCNYMACFNVSWSNTNVIKKHFLSQLN